MERGCDHWFSRGAANELGFPGFACSVVLFI